MFPWNRLRRRKSESAKKAKEADESLAEARRARREQERKLAQEQKSVVRDLDRIAQGNSIAETIASQLAGGEK